jgi:hypothetical protein
VQRQKQRRRLAKHRQRQQLHNNRNQQAEAKGEAASHGGSCVEQHCDHQLHGWNPCSQKVARQGHTMLVLQKVACKEKSSHDLL